MEYEYNGKNGQATRMEMLIALDYLLNNCTSIKKTSKTIELVEYAKSKYNTFIDRRRANGIFDDLVDISANHPELLPFIVKKVPNKPRYYIEKRLWESEDVVKIADSIRGNKKLSKASSKALLEKFLNVAFTDEQIASLSKKLQVKDRGTITKASNQAMKLIDYLEDLRVTVSRFHFSLASTVRYDNASGDFPIGEPLAGYVYEIISDDETTRVCLYLDEYRVAVVVKLEEIIIDTTFEPVQRINRNTLTYELVGRETNIDNWLDGYFSGQNGLRLNVEFKFYALHLEEVRKAYRKYFKKEMEYEIKERREVVPAYDPDNPNATREIIAEDAYATIRTTYRAFKKWYMDNGFFEYMVILNPAYFNDRLVGYLMNRFARRLTRYGEQYDVEIIKTPKAAYLEKIQRRHERIERIRQERREAEENNNN